MMIKEILEGKNEERKMEMMMMKSISTMLYRTYYSPTLHN